MTKLTINNLEVPMATKSKNGVKMLGEDDWRVESDLSTIMAAETIKRDPKRYAKVQALAKQRMADVAAIAAKAAAD